MIHAVCYFVENKKNTLFTGFKNEFIFRNLFFFFSDTFVEICIHYKVTNFLRFGKVFVLRLSFFIAVICLVCHRQIHKHRDMGNSCFKFSGLSFEELFPTLVSFHIHCLKIKINYTISLKYFLICSRLTFPPS